MSLWDIKPLLWTLRFLLLQKAQGSNCWWVSFATRDSSALSSPLSELCVTALHRRTRTRCIFLLLASLTQDNAALQHHRCTLLEVIALNCCLCMCVCVCLRACVCTCVSLLHVYLLAHQHWRHELVGVIKLSHSQMQRSHSTVTINHLTITYFTLSKTAAVESFYRMCEIK